MEANPWVVIKKYKYILLFIGIGVFVYGNSLFGQPIWDDTGYIFDNPDFTSIHLINIFTNNIYVLNGYYRPLIALYYSVTLFVFGHQTFFFHLLQLVMHIANAYMLFLILKKFLDKHISFFVALLFLVHPLTVEAVAYIAAADDVGSFFFGISALYLAICATLSKKTLLCLFLLFLAGLLTKESAIVFLLLAIIYSGLFRKDQLRSIVVVIFASIASYLLIRFGMVGISHHATPLTPIASLSLSQRFFSIPAIFFYYLSNVFFPWKLAIDQQWIISALTMSSFYIPLFFLLASFVFLIFFGVLFYRKQIFGTYIFFLSWFLIGLGLHLQIFPLDMTVADRWFYIPLAGFVGIVGIIVQHSIKNKHIVYATIGIAICLLSIRTMIRNTNWVDRLTLYSHDVHNTQSYELEANLAAELIDAKQYDQALVHAKKSVGMLPLDYNTYNLGTLYEIKNNTFLARQYYYESLSAKSHPLAGHRHIVEMYQGVGEFAALHDSPEKAISVLKQSLRDYPTDGILWMYYAVALYRTGNQSEAEKASENAYNLSQTQNTRYVKEQIFHHLPIVVSDKKGQSQTIPKSSSSN